jgi:hypothetical protein
MEALLDSYEDAFYIKDPKSNKMPLDISLSLMYLRKDIVQNLLMQELEFGLS